jgi:glycosyltransferase involved in cell wall biosynthesis
MRVLHLDSGKSMRGGQWQALALINGLRELGVEQILLAPAGSPLAQKAAALPVDVKALGIKMVLAGAQEADLLHAHDAKSHTLAVLQGKKPVVVSRRVAFPVKRSPLSRWKYARAAKFIAVSKFVAGVLRQAGVPERKIAVVYDGVPLTGPAQSRGLIVAPATDDPAKGSSLLRDAGCEVMFSDDLPRDIQHAAVLAYITYSEGLGSAALLAMAAGVPVVASRVGGLIEVVDHGRTGLLVENDAAQIRGAIAKILQDPRLAADMGARARQRAKEHFSADRMVRQTMRIYEEVLA